MIRVAIAEPHPEMRSAIRLLLGLSSNMEVVFEAENGQQAIEYVEQHQPDVLVMDILVPVLNGLSATRQINDLLLLTRVILISSLTRYGVVEGAMAAGAHGFVPKEELVAMLPEAIETVYQGGRYFSEEP